MENGTAYAVENGEWIMFNEHPRLVNCTPKVRHKTFGVQFRGADANLVNSKNSPTAKNAEASLKIFFAP